MRMGAYLCACLVHYFTSVTLLLVCVSGKTVGVVPFPFLVASGSVDTAGQRQRKSLASLENTPGN